MVRVKRRSQSAGESLYFADKWKELQNLSNVKPKKCMEKHRPSLTGIDGKAIEIFRTESALVDDINIFAELELEHLRMIELALRPGCLSADGYVNINTFQAIFQTVMKTSEPEMDRRIKRLFEKIDVTTKDKISWGEFCTFILLQQRALEKRWRQLQFSDFKSPVKRCPLNHREKIMRILAQPIGGGFVIGSNDGMLSFWTHELILKRTCSLAPSDQSKRLTAKWYTNFVFLEDINKIITCNGDRELEFFEMSTFKPYCRISRLDCVPISMSSGALTSKGQHVLVWGDSNGDVSILLLTDLTELLRSWKLWPQDDCVPTTTFSQLILQNRVEFIRWNVHGEWVLKVHFEPTIEKIISCCNQKATAVVIGCICSSTILPAKPGQSFQRQASTRSLLSNGLISKEPNFGPEVTPDLVPKLRQAFDQKVFKINKGAHTFAFSKAKNILVTGGMDRIIRIWNPYITSKSIGKLTGHSSPTLYLHINEEENSLISVASDKCIKVWDNISQTCLATFGMKGTKSKEELQGCTFSPTSRTLLIVTDQIALVEFEQNPYLNEKLWWLKHTHSQYHAGCFFSLISTKKSIRDADIFKQWSMQTEPIRTHKAPVTAFKYNANFSHVITACQNSIIKVWNYVNGELIFEFDRAHGEQAVTCMCLDLSGRRLITGGQDGFLRIWNYHIGSCLQELRSTPENTEECNVSAVQCINIGQNYFIVSVGWDRKINIFSDDVRTKGETHCNSVHKVQYPLPQWRHDEVKGHAEDILALATFCGSQTSASLLVTSDFAGEILVWNIISGHLFKRLKRHDFSLVNSSTKIILVTTPEANENQGAIQSINNQDTVDDDDDSNHRATFMSHLGIETKRNSFLFHHKVPTRSPSRSRKQSTADSRPSSITCTGHQSHTPSKLRHCELHGTEAGGKLGVNKLLILENRKGIKEAASLVSCGPSDKIHFWAVYAKQNMYASFRSSSIEDVFPTTIAAGQKMTDGTKLRLSQVAMRSEMRRRSRNGMVNNGIETQETPIHDSHLFVGDETGRIQVWNILNYCLTEPTLDPPELLCKWHAHLDSITGLESINSNETLISSSLDFCVRLWKWDGTFIGTFGQPSPWNLQVSASFQHPMGPFDVLIDPKSEPLMMITKLNQSNKNTTMSSQRDFSKNIKSRMIKINFNRSETIIAETENCMNAKDNHLSSRCLTNDSIRGALSGPNEINVETEGKQLRHLRNDPKPLDSGAPNDYHRLLIVDFSKEPDMIRPKVCSDEQELEDFLAAKLVEPVPPVHQSIEQQIIGKI